MRNRETDDSPVSFAIIFLRRPMMDFTYDERDRIRLPDEAAFRRWLPEFNMGQLKYMYRIIQTKGMIRYCGANTAKRYKKWIYDRMVSRKVRGTECEIWD